MDVAIPLRYEVLLLFLALVEIGLLAWSLRLGEGAAAMKQSMAVKGAGQNALGGGSHCG